MEDLELSRNEISDEAAVVLAQSSHKIQILGLWNCSLTTIGWKSVFSGIAKLDEKVILVRLLFSFVYVQFSLI